jgi:hypothetical protein
MSVTPIELLLQRCTRQGIIPLDAKSVTSMGLLLQMCTSIIPLDNDLCSKFNTRHVISSIRGMSLCQVLEHFFQKMSNTPSLHICSIPHSTPDSCSIHTQQFIYYFFSDSLTDTGGTDRGIIADRSSGLHACSGTGRHEISR